jgi:hypothetical protein
MDTDREYRNGYDAGYAQTERLPAQEDAWYTGYEDGDGDRWANRPNAFEEMRPVEDEYYLVNAAPPGFEWAGHKEIPTIGDWYLSKMGNATKALKVRANEQKRHILTVTGCGCYNEHGKYDHKRCGVHY